MTIEDYKALTERNKSEATLQEECANFLRCNYPNLNWFHCPNEAKRSKALAGILSRQGLKAGVSDIIILEARGGYFGLMIELKRIDGKPTQAQCDFISQCNGSGYLAYVVYRIDDFESSVNWYMQRPLTAQLPTLEVEEKPS